MIRSLDNMDPARKKKIFAKAEEFIEQNSC